MIRSTTVAILSATTIAAAALTPATVARATTRYDGAWSVVIYTKTGPCDASYRFSGQIVNGIINYGTIGVNFTGRVRSSGAAYVRVSSGSSYAVAYGRLTINRGSGTWHGQASSGYCTGKWVATRT